MAKKKKSPYPAIIDTLPGIYEVKGIEYTDGEIDSGMGFVETVAANDAEEAIFKVRKHFIGADRSWEDDEGKLHTSSVSHVLIKSVSFVVEASIR